MGKFSACVTINRPAQEVFDFLNDQRNHATLNPHNFRNYRVLSGHSSGVGARSQFVLKTGAFEEAVEVQVTHSQPPTLLVEEGRLKEGRFRTNWRLIPINDSQTDLELTTEYQADGAAALFGGVIQKAFIRIYERLLTDLARKLAAPA